MNTSQINNAISSLVADDAKEEVRPIYERMSAMVNATRIGEAIVIKGRKSDPSFGTQFHCRIGENEWQYGNGTSAKTTDDVITAFVSWKMTRKVKFTRLVKGPK